MILFCIRALNKQLFKILIILFKLKFEYKYINLNLNGTILKTLFYKVVALFSIFSYLE